MRNFRLIPRVGLAVLSLLMLLAPAFSSVAIAADTSAGGQLMIRQLNITGDEFVVLQNQGSSPLLHLNEYWLGYSGGENATNVIPTQQLPDVALLPGQAYLLHGGDADICGAVGVSKLSFSLSNSGGTLVLRRLVVNTELTSTFQTVQYLSWGKKVASSSTYANMNDETAVANYQKDSGTPGSISWYSDAASSDSAAAKWQAGYLRGCTFTPVISKTVTAAPQLIEWQAAEDMVPFTVEAAQVYTYGSSGPYLPAADIGLKALMLSEVLPNPASPQTDADDEFIELYNPNGSDFDLTGFKFQVGSTTSSAVRSYSFKAGTVVAAKSFAVFKSADTHLSLSNSGGQVWLIDPFGNTVTGSEVYGTAKDGLAWINVNNKWQWTALPTPGAANKVSAPAAGSGAAKAATVNGKSVTAVKGASAATGTSGSGALAAGSAPTTPVHPLILVAVVLAGLLYGAYEYQSDVANRFYQFRANRAARRSARK